VKSYKSERVTSRTILMITDRMQKWKEFLKLEEEAGAHPEFFTGRGRGVGGAW